MSIDSCPHCGSTKRHVRHNKWHIREVYCGECSKCLNSEHVRERTRLAEKAAQAGKLEEFWQGTYQPSD